MPTPFFVRSVTKTVLEDQKAFYYLGENVKSNFLMVSLASEALSKPCRLLTRVTADEAGMAGIMEVKFLAQGNNSGRKSN